LKKDQLPLNAESFEDLPHLNPGMLEEVLLLLDPAKIMPLLVKPKMCEEMPFSQEMFGDTVLGRPRGLNVSVIAAHIPDFQQLAPRVHNLENVPIPGRRSKKTRNQMVGINTTIYAQLFTTRCWSGSLKQK
jgi:hypothetical protein